MRDHNLCFNGEILKIIPRLFLLTFKSGALVGVLDPPSVVVVPILIMIVTERLSRTNPWPCQFCLYLSWEADYVAFSPDLYIKLSRCCFHCFKWIDSFGQESWLWVSPLR